MDFYYHGIWRMDWGFGNPNKTAALIACLTIAIWTLPLLWRAAFWPALGVGIALAVCLVQTYSRGGMLAFLAGIAVLLFWVPRPWPKARVLGVLAALWICGGFVLYAKAQTRYGQGLFTDDQSIDNRLVIWRHVPQMMAAAPWGLGFGQAGDAYTQWFEPLDRRLSYLNLINSHFTWMAEGGWIFSACYLFAWLAILLLCWPAPRMKLRAVPLAVWTAFGVGACFSHVEESIWLWILPLVALAYVLTQRKRLHLWPSSRAFVSGGVLSVSLVAILVLLGLRQSSLPIASTKDEVVIGNGPVKSLIFVDRKVLGSFYGQTFRKFLAQNPRQLAGHTYTLVESSNHLPDSDLACLVVTGKFAMETGLLSRLNDGEQIVLVNPACFPEEARLNHDLIDKTIVYFGEYSQASSRSSWTSYPGINTRQIGGASDFIPSWPQAILIPDRT